VVVHVEGTRPGYLVLTDIWFPGWKCIVDEHSVPIYRADFLFRAVPVPAGEHEVVFTFAPRSYCCGRWITGLALAIAAAVLGLSWLSSFSRRACSP
jgi:uncharacterized membrane protein YfhO